MLDVFTVIIHSSRVCLIYAQLVFFLDTGNNNNNRLSFQNEIPISNGTDFKAETKKIGLNFHQYIGRIKQINALKVENHLLHNIPND